MKAVRSVERALEIMLAFIKKPVMDASTLQQISGLPRPTLYRILATLEENGLVTSSGDPRQYRLTHRTLELSTAYLSTLSIVDASEATLQELWRKTKETVSLFTPQGKTRILLKEWVSPQPLMFTRGAGHVAPLWSGAAGKAILAFSAQDAVDTVLKELPNPSARTRVIKELTLAKQRRYHISHGEVIEGATSIASPILDRNGDAAGSVAVFGPSVRLEGAVLEKARDRLLEATTRISAAMGCPPALLKSARNGQKKG